jgi:hypothetical protein
LRGPQRVDLRGGRLLDADLARVEPRAGRRGNPGAKADCIFAHAAPCFGQHNVGLGLPHVAD